MLFAPLAASAALGVGKAIVGDIAKTVQSAVGSSAGSAAKTAAEAKAKKASTDFESMFLEQSLDRLSQSEGTDGPLGENGTGGGVDADQGICRPDREERRRRHRRPGVP